MGKIIAQLWSDLAYKKECNFNQNSSTFFIGKQNFFPRSENSHRPVVSTPGSNEDAVPGIRSRVYTPDFRGIVRIK